MASGSEIAEWIEQVHAALVPLAQERVGAQWGPVQARHRTTRPEWYADFDTAWARPVTSSPSVAQPEVNVITAAFADLPADFQPPALARADLGARGEVLSLTDTDSRLIWGVGPGEVIGWNRGSGAAVVLRHERPNGYDQVSPLRLLVHWSVVAAGGLLVHGACVGRRTDDGARGLLVLGDAGFGKSTTTLACLEAGWVTCGDDAVAVFPDERGWSARPVYGAVKTKLGPDAQRDLGRGLDTVTWDINGHKRVHLLTATDDSSVVDRVDLDALVLLRPDGGPTDPWTPISPADVRNGVAPSTALPLAYERSSVLERLGRLALEVPGFALPRRNILDDTVTDVGAILADARPRVSVIVPVYDGERHVATAIRSILDQTVGRFQIVVVDDASPDAVIDVVESMRELIEDAGHRLDVVRLTVNGGVGAARNAGLNVADEEFVGFLDQDDIWPPERTAALMTLLRRTNALLVTGRMRFVDAMPGVHRPWVRDNWFEGDHPGHAMGALLARTEVFDLVGGLDESFRNGADDTDWMLRLRASGASTAASDVVTLVRSVHDRNQSRRTAADHSELFAAVRAHVHRKSDTAVSEA